ncbi:MAG: hypothetical protein ACLRH0_07110 [Blautia wexlerae]
MKDYRPPKYAKPLKAVPEPAKRRKKPEKENSRSDNKPKKKFIQ